MHFLKDMSAAMRQLESLAKKLEEISEELQFGQQLSEPAQELRNAGDSLAEVCVSNSMQVQMLLGSLVPRPF